MRKWIFIGIGSLVGLIICFLAIPFILNPFVKDAARQDDSDICPLTLAIPDADNAYFDLQKAAEVYATDTNIRDKNTELQLSKNAATLKLFADASTKKYYQEPEYARPDTIRLGMELPKLNVLRNIAVLKEKEAVQMLVQGNSTEAINTALEDIKIGKLLQDSQADPMTILNGIAIARIGNEAMQQILADKQISTYNFSTNALRMEKYEPDAKKRDLAFRVNYQTMASIFDGHNLGLEGLDEKASHLIFWYRPVETHNMFADFNRYQIAQSKDCKNIDERAARPSPYTIESNKLFQPTLYITPNAIGKILYSVIAYSDLGIQIKQCQSTLQARNLAIAFALHAYKETNGNFPASLDQLVPKYIESIPVDPFTEQAPKYSIKDRTIYSETYESGKEKITPLNLPTRIYHF
jgi:hypothetical protein